MKVIAICSRCGKRAKHESEDKVEVKVNNELLKGNYMLCKCDNCDTKFLVEVE